MQQKVSLFGLILFWLVVTASGSPFQDTHSKAVLRRNEYEAVALASQAEVYALGERAIFPICVKVDDFKELPRQLLDSLRASDVQASAKLNACFPLGDWPHGLKISVNKIVRSAEGQLDVGVDSSDVTLGPAIHFAQNLRRGVYHLTRDAQMHWHVAGYTKDYDYKDAH